MEEVEKERGIFFVEKCLQWKRILERPVGGRLGQMTLLKLEGSVTVHFLIVVCYKAVFGVFSGTVKESS